MKWLVGLLVGLAVLVLGVWLILPQLISKEGLVAKAETEASEMLGRRVEIGEVTGIALLPPRITVRGLEVANAEGFDDPYLARVEEARLGVALMPLLQSRVKIETFDLSEPTIYLAAKADGSNNYTLGPDASQNEPATEASGSGDTVIVGSIKVSDGRLTYRSPDASYAVTALDADLTLPEPGGTMQLRAGMQLEGIESTLDVAVMDFWQFVEAGRGNAEASLNLGGNAFEGSFAMGLEPFSLEGPITLSLREPAALTPLLGASAVEATQPFGAITLAGTAKMTEDSVAFEGATYDTAISAGAGDLSLLLGGARPKLTGRVTAQRADLRPFFPEDEGAAPAQDAPFPAWSEDPIDLSGLTSFDADIAVRAKAVTLPTYKLEDVAGRVVIDAGKVRLDLENAETLGGTAAGVLTLDAAANEPRIATDFTFENVNFADAGPALLGSRRLLGEGDIRFDVTTRGASQAAWVRNLSGEAGVDVTGGRILGIDLNLLARTALDLVDGLRGDGLSVATVAPALSPLAANAAAQGAETNFSLANFDATIASGKTQLTEASILSDTLRATVGGAVDLPAQGLDLRILLAAKAPDAESYREFIAPVAVGGSFSDPKIQIDAQPIVSNLVRGEANKVLEGTGIEIKEGESVGDALRNRAQSELLNILGGGRRKREAPPAEEPVADEPPSETTTEDEPPAR
ncbi:MAG: AsmA family protein [Parvularcula sp.]|jgi:AsmA protein|nr:AsmA family protein [Parvularcula sp.]